MSSNSELAHYGVKGMKWGVRKEYVPHPRKTSSKQGSSKKTSKRSKMDPDDKRRERNKKIAKALLATAAGVALGTAAYKFYREHGREYLDTVIKAGTNIQHLTNDGSNKETKRVFASYTDRDNKAYDARLGRLLSYRESDVYKRVFSSSKDIRIPSDRNAAKLMKKLMDSDSDFKRYVDSFSKNKDLKKIYEEFGSKAFVDGSKNGQKQLQKFFDLLKENGYNGVSDIYDRKVSGMDTRNPVLIFDMKNVVEKSVTRLANGAYDEAEEIYLNKIRKENRQVRSAKFVSKALGLAGAATYATTLKPNKKNGKKKRNTSSDVKHGEEIYHYGVKGMKWGVRKEYSHHPRKAATKALKKDEQRERNKKIALGLLAGAATIAIGSLAYNAYRKNGKYFFDTVVKAGTEFQRITSIPNQRSNRVYAFYKSGDRDRYIGHLGEARMDQNNKAFVKTLKSVKEIRAPSDRKAAKLMESLMKTDPDFKKYVESLRGYSDQINGVKSGRSMSANYNNLNVLGPMHIGQNGDQQMQKFYNLLKQNGYNAITDFNDRFHSDLNARNPIIIFDMSSVVEKSVDRLDRDTINNAKKKTELIDNGAKYVATTLGVSGGMLYMGNKSEKNSNGKNVKHSNDLAHYGVKGMKWGVRKEYVPHPRQRARITTITKATSSGKTKLSPKDAVSSFLTRVKRTTFYNYYRVNGKKYVDTVVKEGTTFQRVTVNPDEKLDRMYAVYKPEDKNLYKGRLGQLRKMQTGGSVYSKEFTAKKAVKAPSDKKSEEFLKTLMDRDKEFAEYVKSLKDSGFNRVNKHPITSYDHYKNFNLAGVMDQSQNGMKQAQKYYRLLKRNGYNAVTDLNDRKYSSFKADNPIILFDMKDFVETSVKEISNKEIRNALAIDQLRRSGTVFTNTALKISEKEYGTVKYSEELGGGIITNPEELYHYGVRGMKWGVRKKYQPHPRALLRKQRLRKAKITKTADTVNRARSKDDYKTLSDDELRARLNRMNMEKQYKNLYSELETPGRHRAEKIGERFVDQALVGVAVAGAAGVTRKYGRQVVDKIMHH